MTLSRMQERRSYLRRLIVPTPVILAISYIVVYIFLDLLLWFYNDYDFRQFWLTPIVGNKFLLINLFQLFNFMFVLFVLLGFVIRMTDRSRKQRATAICSFSFALILLGALQVHLSNVKNVASDYEHLAGENYAPLVLPSLKDGRREENIIIWIKDNPNGIDKYGRTGLHYLPMVYEYPCDGDMTEKLVRNFKELNVPDNYGRMPLHYMDPLTYGDKDYWYVDPCEFESCAQALIALGADINARDSAGLTLLHYVFLHREWDYCLPYMLIANGADLNAQDNLGRTPMHYAVKNWPVYPKEMREDVEFVRFSVEIKFKTYWQTLTTSYGVPDSWYTQEMISILVGRGANIHIKDKFGESPLDFVQKLYPYYRESTLKALHNPVFIEPPRQSKKPYYLETTYKNRKYYVEFFGTGTKKPSTRPTDE